MREVLVQYHREPDGWWAESPDLPGYSAAGESFDEVREQVREGLPLHIGEHVELMEEGVPQRVRLSRDAAGHRPSWAWVQVPTAASVIRRLDATWNLTAPPRDQRPAISQSHVDNRT